ncbi:hypothetical protein J3Q64DRAFT_1708799 [Phycomyces blakesleeanus]|uniref:BTB domain-containing protein n=1 Tax=Phycomyces blakesleeanus TaxID=4837 RepID=A0ABR3BE11_PHYBL
MPGESPITQVSNQNDLIYQQRSANDEEYDDYDDYDDYEDDLTSTGDPNPIPQILHLDLRGTRVDLDRETLVSLPESLLIAMFPHGLALNKQDTYSENDDDPSSVENDSTMWTFVDFDPACLDYVLEFYRQALTHPLPTQLNTAAYSPLTDKHPIIVLREELEYFGLPNIKGDMAALKVACGQHLVQHDSIFSALQKNINRQKNVAEQHLIEMLCDAGFESTDKWGFRALEPMRTCITSMGMVMLKTSGSEHAMATAQKLLLFWRKPERKCWWDGTSFETQGQAVRLWARRTWTLELALV